MKNERSVLTRADVEAAQPADKEYRLWDARVPGLCLRVQPGGAKAWNIRWSAKRDKVIGRYPVMTLEAARAKALAVLADAADGDPEFARAKPKDLTLEQFIDDHYAPLVRAENRAAEATLASIKAQFGKLYGRRLRSLESKDFDDFRAARTRAKIKPATVNRDLDRIRAALNQALAWKFLDANPAAKVKRVVVGKRRVRFLTADEERQLRDALDRRDRQRRAARERGNAFNAERGYDQREEWAPDEYTDYLTPMTLLALATGMRRGELFGLRWPAVSIHAGLLTVVAENSKSQTERHVHLNSEAQAILLRWKGKGERKGLVFPGPGGVQLKNINKAWAKLMTKAKLADFRFHDCRHSFASRLVMGGVDLNTARELLGHSDLSMTTRYAHLSADHRAQAVESLVTGGGKAPSAAALKLLDDIADKDTLQELLRKLSAKLEG